MYRRYVAVFFATVFLFGVLQARLGVLAFQDSLLAAAQQQSTFLLDVADTRGVIYDRNLRPLTNSSGGYVAAVLPCEQSADVLLRNAGLRQRAQLMQKLEALVPFLWEVDTDGLYARGLEIFYVPQRHLDEQPAVHLIGQLDPATGRGASGLERAYDELLSSAGGTLKVRYATDALRRGLSKSPPEILDSGYNSGAGLVLTIDRDIQQLTEQAAQSIERGAVVVMDPYTGDLLASVSRPDFNPNNPAASLNDERSPFINRAFYAYSVGSIFKLLVAATALEQGLTESHRYTCTGSIEVDGQQFRCHNPLGHGPIDMTTAIEKSCNTYFISLALGIGGRTLAYKAAQLGFSSVAELAPGLRTASGTLPSDRDLAAPAAQANLGFGQGALTATPIQIAALVSSMVNSGGAVTPRLVAGTTPDGISMSSRTAIYGITPVFLPEAADEVRRMMISVVQQGSGQNAQPETGGAGGKTSSAQTGQYVDGREVVHAWFAGFYPAENPQYAIVVLVEAGESGSDTACPVFRQIADGLAGLQASGGAAREQPAAEPATAPAGA
jgi:penicillin-binding protein 2